MLSCCLGLQGPTSGVYQEADRLQQLQQQQLQQHQQQQRSADSEALQLNASLTPITAASDPAANPGPMQTSQDPAGEAAYRVLPDIPRASVPAVLFC